jgi:hypothetical protein
MKAFFTFLHAVLIAVLAVILLYLCLVLAEFIAFMNPYMTVVVFSCTIGALILWIWRRYRNPPTNTVFDKAMNYTIKPKPKGSITGLTDGAKIFMIVGYFFIFVPIFILIVAAKGSIIGLADWAKIFMIVGYFVIFVPISILIVVVWVLEEMRNKNNV